jgi:hypothetical protein
MNGVVSVQHNQALGAFGPTKQVNSGAGLEIQDSRDIQANLVLNGSGYGNDNSGAVRVFSTLRDPQFNSPIPAVVNLSGNVTERSWSPALEPTTIQRRSHRHGAVQHMTANGQRGLNNMDEVDPLIRRPAARTPFIVNGIVNYGSPPNNLNPASMWSNRRPLCPSTVKAGGHHGTGRRYANQDGHLQH